MTVWVFWVHATAVPCCSPSSSQCSVNRSNPWCVLQEVSKAQAANRARLDAEYRRLVDNLVEAQQLRGGEEWLSNPTLPDDVVQESMPGTPQCLSDDFLFKVRAS